MSDIDDLERILGRGEMGLRISLHLCGHSDPIIRELAVYALNGHAIDGNERAKQELARIAMHDTSEAVRHAARDVLS